LTICSNFGPFKIDSVSSRFLIASFRTLFNT